MPRKFYTPRKLQLISLRFTAASLFVGSLFCTFLTFHQIHIAHHSRNLKQSATGVLGSFGPATLDTGTKSGPKFVYLIQTEQCLPSAILDSAFLGSSALCSCEVQVLSYKSACLNNTLPHVLYTFDKISWSGGRNKLYQLAKQRDFGQVLFFMFLDDDIRLTFNEFAPEKLLVGPPLRAFEEFLLEHEPAVGVPDYDKHHGASVMFSKRRKLCRQNGDKRTSLHIPTVHFDASFTAIHRNATEYLLPYPTEYDKTCYWHSQRYLIAAAEIQFRGQVVMFTPVRAINTEHREYPRDDSDARTIWSRFVKEFVAKRVPAAFSDRKILKEFEANPEKYTENSLSVCIDAPPKYPIEPFRHFTWNLQTD